MKHYKKLNVKITKEEILFEGKAINNYIDVINEYSSYGWTLNQVLALPSNEQDVLTTLEIILETEDEQLFQGFSY